MVIAMIAVWMVQVAIDEIVDVIAVRHGFVPAAGAVHMVGSVCTAGMLRGAGGGIVCSNGNDVFIYMIAMRMMQVAVMQIIDMPVMQHCGMAAIRAMLVGVVSVLGVCASRHDQDSFRGQVEKVGAMHPGMVTVSLPQRG